MIVEELDEGDVALGIAADGRGRVVEQIVFLGGQGGLAALRLGGGLAPLQFLQRLVDEFRLAPQQIADDRLDLIDRQLDLGGACAARILRR